MLKNTPLPSKLLIEIPFRTISVWSKAFEWLRDIFWPLLPLYAYDTYRWDLLKEKKKKLSPSPLYHLQVDPPKKKKNVFSFTSLSLSLSRSTPAAANIRQRRDSPDPAGSGRGAAQGHGSGRGEVAGHRKDDRRRVAPRQSALAFERRREGLHGDVNGDGDCGWQVGEAGGRREWMDPDMGVRTRAVASLGGRRTKQIDGGGAMTDGRSSCAREELERVREEEEGQGQGSAGLA